MKYRKVFMCGIRFVLGVLIVVLLWNPFGKAVRFYSLGSRPTLAHDVGDGYEIWSGSRLRRWIHHKDRDEIIAPLKEGWLEKWIRVDPWLIGLTDEKQWFVINKKVNAVYYPLLSEKEVKTITGLDISALNFITDSANPPSPSYYALERSVEKVVTKAKRILFFIPFLVGFGPNIWHLFWFLVKHRK